MFFRLIIWLIMIIGGGIISIYFDSRFFPVLFSNKLFHYVSFVFGVLLMRAVIVVSKNTGRTLAKYGRKGEIKRMETNLLVKEGPYKFMRHPMHLGLLFFPLAFALLLGSPSFILIVSPIEIIFMIIMIRKVEEPEAIKKFGDAYKKYMQTTPSFCIRKECLVELFKKVKK